MKPRYMMAAILFWSACAPSARGGKVETRQIITAEYRFGDETLQSQYFAAREHLVRWAAEEPSKGPIQSGNFLHERWCSAQVDPSLCERGLANRSQVPGSKWWELSTYTYPQSYPEVFGLGFSSGHVPTESPFSIRVSYSVGAKRITNSYAHITVTPTGKSGDEQVFFGSSLSWESFDKTIRVSLLEEGKTDAAFMGDLLASPEAFEGAVQRGYDKLRDEVIRALDAGEVKREELLMDEYQNDGVPPPSEFHELTKPELTLEKAKLQAELDRRRAFLITHKVDLVSKLNELVPPVIRR